MTCKEGYFLQNESPRKQEFDILHFDGRIGCFVDPTCDISGTG